MHSGNFKEILSILGTPISQALKVYAPHLSALKRLEISSLRDLLFYIPRDYKPRIIEPNLDYLSLPAEVVLKVEVITGLAKVRGQLIAQLLCQGRIIDLIFFKRIPEFLRARLKLGQKLTFSGSLSQHKGRLQIIHPQIVHSNFHVQALEPLYPLTYGISNRSIASYALKGIEYAKEQLKELPEWNAIAGKLNLPTFFGAIETVHRPENEEKAKEALKRLAIDELIAYRAQMAGRALKNQGRSFSKGKLLQERVMENLAFTLSASQERAVAEIERDQLKQKQMIRLLQGDVGSGKTLVALLTALNVAHAGMQTAILAPTELLAQQHYRFINSALEGTEIEHCLLTGALSSKEKREALEKIKLGTRIVVGTHALFQKGVEFHSLGYIVVDEQHRFGVGQRLALIDKADTPDVLLLSATPIPRSLALVALGDIPVSKLDSLPQHGQITTLVMPASKRNEIYESIEKVIKRQEKVYWVCPLIEQDEESSIKDIEGAFASISQQFPGKAAMLHGAMEAQLRTKVMEEFCSGKTSILVATTIIETGIDVKSATIIVIENADRFGLAQLHQLRGRVGRNKLPSYCILLYSERSMSATAMRRLGFLKTCKDGFLVAQEDLILRGRGEILGTKQSGKQEFYFADKVQLDEDVLRQIVEMDSRDPFVEGIFKSNSDSFLPA